MEDAVGEIYDEMKYMREREEAMRNTNGATALVTRGAPNNMLFSCSP